MEGLYKHGAKPHSSLGPGIPEGVNAGAFFKNELARRAAERRGAPPPLHAESHPEGVALLQLPLSRPPYPDLKSGSGGKIELYFFIVMKSRSKRIKHTIKIQEKHRPTS